jgi:hypothetical protein
MRHLMRAANLEYAAMGKVMHGSVPPPPIK